MKKNMGNFDRMVRVILAIVAIFLFYNKIATSSLLIVGAVALLLTSLSGKCPVYSLFGIRTCASDRVHAG